MTLDELNENTLRCFSDEMLVEIKKNLKDIAEKKVEMIDKVLKERSKNV